MGIYLKSSRCYLITPPKKKFDSKNKPKIFPVLTFQTIPTQCGFTTVVFLFCLIMSLKTGNTTHRLLNMPFLSTTIYVIHCSRKNEKKMKKPNCDFINCKYIIVTLLPEQNQREKKKHSTRKAQKDLNFVQTNT